MRKANQKWRNNHLAKKLLQLKDRTESPPIAIHLQKRVDDVKESEWREAVVIVVGG